MEEVVFLNNKFLPVKEVGLSALSTGVLNSWGVFETMRSYNQRIVYFEEHLKRIKNCSKLIAIKFPHSLNKLKKIIRQTIKINGFKDAYIRLTLWKSEQRTDTLIIVKKYNPYPAQKYIKGFSAGVSRFKQNENSFLARIKTTNRLLYELSFQEAKQKGFDEAVILNNRGHISEASRSNLFFAKDNSLFTPHLECGCLDGITRKVIFGFAKHSKIKIYEGSFGIPDLYQADEAFLTNSLMGVMPLTSLEQQAIGKAKCGRITENFIKKYNLLLKNGT
jgi:branched-subunit amino acid aminotransferase/4-amino-4-deoxychorismate lyase